MASGIFFVLREPLSSSSLLRFPEPQAPSPPPLRRSSSPLPAAAAPPLSSSPTHRDGVRAPRRAPAAEQHELRRRHGYNAIDTEDGYKIRICHLLNIPRTRDKTLSLQRLEFWKFQYGFLKQWLKLAYPNMKQQNEQSQSASTTNTPRHPIEYWMGKFLSDDGTNPMRYALEENDFLRRVYQQYGCTCYPYNHAYTRTKEDRLRGCGRCVITRHWNVDSCHVNSRMQGNRGWIITPPISISVNESTCSFCPNSKVDDNILATSKIMSVEKECYRRRVGCGQAKEDANIQHENMQSCSSERSSTFIESITKYYNESNCFSV
ncbi:uncharacterized protein [Setaria viridis]|uniref:uncharacterized protein n=1 Tax=Setaria viridis TaxID=4556 RepID=UPI003B3A9036